MKICGHTMGTPGRDVFEAMELLSRIGFDGIEIRCAEDGQLDIETYELGSKRGDNIVGMARDLEMDIVCLTPYYFDLGDPDARDAEISNLRKTILIAEELECGLVRCFAKEPDAENMRSSYWNNAIDSLKVLGQFAAEHDVGLCIETHGGSLAVTAEQAVQMVEDVGLPSVGILLDYPWIYREGSETEVEAVRMVAPHLKHVHAKDWKIKPEGKTTTLMGEGDINWPALLRELEATGYDGYISDEYEKQHRDYLPEPQTGMKADLHYLRDQCDHQ